MTAISTPTVLDELRDRGLFDASTDDEALQARLRRGRIRLYCGFDPTADSLHVGSLQGLAVLRLFALAGHQPIALVGGATGMIGDPSGRSTQRNLLNDADLDHNRAALDAQISRLLTLPSGVAPTMVDNRDWFSGMSAIAFLRDVGTWVSVAHMLERSSVKLRLGSAEGLSFTELSYQVLQAHDFVHLRRELDCELQVGGSDQWGNITAGTDMIRRQGLPRAFGLVWPLMVKGDGQKFGKSEQGNIWLHPKRTSAFAFHQFWFNASDVDVRGLLLKFTLRSVAEVEAIMSRHRVEPAARHAQRVLADDVTTWVHGASACAAVNRAAAALFSGSLDASVIDRLEREIPTLSLDRGELAAMSLPELLHRGGLADSMSDGRRAVEGGGVYVNGTRASRDQWAATPGAPWILLARGRRRHVLIRVGE